MLKINFYPEQNNPDFEKASIEYTKLWEGEGNKIVATIEEVSGLKFKEKIINALVFDDVSYSVPLQLTANVTLERKRGALVHELCHRLVVRNNIKVESRKSYNSWILAIHKHIDLVLYDVWVKLYGENFAKREIKYEISLWNRKGISPYKIAWDWALSMTKEGRRNEFKKYLL